MQPHERSQEALGLAQTTGGDVAPPSGTSELAGTSKLSLPSPNAAASSTVVAPSLLPQDAPKLSPTETTSTALVSAGAYRVSPRKVTWRLQGKQDGVALLQAHRIDVPHDFILGDD